MSRPLSIGFAVLAVSLGSAAPPDSLMRAIRWEKEVSAIEKRLEKHPPSEGGLAFVGSSSIRLWNLPVAFPDRNAVNLGFGGSQIADQTLFAHRLILPLKPRTIVFYAGDNDIAGKRSPRRVRDDFQAFVRLIHRKLPRTRILYLPIKPSLRRWNQFETQEEANALVKEICDDDERLVYVDIVPAMLGPDGEPKPELFIKDGLHLSPAGYEVWNGLVRTALGAR